MAATLNDLKEAVKDGLEKGGSLGKVQAHLRAEVFKLLSEESKRPTPHKDSLIVNELIREYLKYNGYSHTLSVFDPESGYNAEEAIPLSIVKDGLNVKSEDVPALYSIVEAVKK
eukprot:TRINITY_DN782427_c0_g1_i1.p1 TRINITY_DN782427_c0_g1~~TRINITY_DN782427_c0_g1_i1.p1  ORF type:complete len:114 (-),score=27.05 TRINITY_DN782427_c0_g1_i1:283-624(-)